MSTFRTVREAVDAMIAQTNEDDSAEFRIDRLKGVLFRIAKEDAPHPLGGVTVEEAHGREDFFNALERLVLPTSPSATPRHAPRSRDLCVRWRDSETNTCVCVTKLRQTKPDMEPAIAILESLNRPVVSIDDVSTSAEWWEPMGAGRMRCIPYTHISMNADREYAEFRTVDPMLCPSSNYETKLREWLAGIPLDELAALIDSTPSGLEADGHQPAVAFTPWQRLSMAVYMKLPVSIEASVHVSPEVIKDLSARTCSTSTRKIPIGCHLSLVQGSFPDCGIVDLPTASGKTAWACSVGLLALTDERFQCLTREAVQRAQGAFQQGSPVLKLARVVIVASAPATFHHFLQTYRRLVPKMRQIYPHLTFLHWDNVGTRCTLSAAAHLPANHVLFWLVPVDSLNKVLRAHPDVTVPVCIVDEFTVDTPRETSRTYQSRVLKRIITQATPQALVRATHGRRTWLQDIFGGTLFPPSHLRSLVVHRSWTDAQLAAEQACKLELMTLTPFREFVRNDLQFLIPPSLDVHFLSSRRMTLASDIMNTSNDIVPISLADAVLNAITRFYPTEESRDMLRSTLVGTVTPETIRCVLRQMVSRYPESSTSNGADIARVCDRLDEFDHQCPICFDDAQAEVRLFGCCGYCVCQRCHQGCQRCPFCRSPLQTTTTCDDEALTDRRHLYPRRPVQPVARTLEETLEQTTNANDLQLRNMVNTLHAMQAHGYRRLILVVERSHASYNFDVAVDRDRISAVTGYDVVFADNLLHGQGRRFVAVKDRFDDRTEPPMALMTFGCDSSLLVGTNLDHTDAIVVLGEVPDHTLTQTLGRVFRPMASRDNTRPIKLVRVVVPVVASRRRGRE